MARFWLVCAAAAALAGLPGCVGYDTWPPIKQDTAANDPDSPPMDEIIMVGVRWMIDRHPPEGHSGPVAVNIPTGVAPKHYRRIVARTHERAVPLTHEAESLPLYHVKSIRVRGVHADITVLRPVPEVPPGPDGAVTQAYTLYLEGGFEPWHVVRWKAWAVGLTEPPSPHFLDDAEAAPASP